MNEYKYMKLILWALTIVSFGLPACHKTNSSPADDDVSALYYRFHGKYKAISSASNEAIDVNLDGTTSKDMISEIPDLIHADLEIRIYQNKTPLFTQFWPEQYFDSNIPPVTYDSTVLINYPKQGVTRLFKFDSGITQIILYPDEAPVPDSIHFPFPKSVTIETNDNIRVISTKHLFTRSGWKDVEITTIYERYTMET